MKDILIQFAQVFMVVISCIFQLVALIFAGIRWVTDKVGTWLSCVGTIIMEKAKQLHKEEEDSEVIPT